MGIEGYLITVLLVGIYFIPTFIASRKEHYHKKLIVRTNVLGIILVVISPFTGFGGSVRLIAVIFWLVALIWCFVDTQKFATVATTSQSTESDDVKNRESE